MGNRQLPDTPKRPMDETHLTLLIRNAMTALIEFVRKRSFQIETIDIYQPCPETGSMYQPLSRPKVREAAFVGYIERIELPAAKLLLDYIWEFGGHSLTFAQDGGEPSRTGWAQSAFHAIIAAPLWRFWDEHSIKKLSSTGEWVPWEVPDLELDRLASCMASIEIGKGAKIKVTVPFLQLNLKETKEFELEKDIKLKVWGQDDRAFYLSRNYDIYPFEHVSLPLSSHCYLEIIARTSHLSEYGKGQEALEEFVSSILARVKWAIMQATDPTQLIRELPATAEIHYQMSAYTPIRRQAIPRTRRGQVTLDVESCNYVTGLLQMLSRALEKYPDLKDVIWLYDRATIAGLARDVLLESAIGFERLLVSGSGENARSFRTYGTALIGGGAYEETFRFLRDIYSARSKAAHGGDIDSNRYEALSVRSRVYLSEAITNVVRLVSSGKIRPINKEYINESIERYLVSLTNRAVQEDLLQALHQKDTPKVPEN